MLLYYSTAKIMLFWLLYSIIFSFASSSSSAIVAPFASEGIRPVVNRLRTLQCITASYFARSLDLIWKNDIIVEK